LAAVDREAIRTGRTAWAWAADRLPRHTCIRTCTRTIRAVPWVIHMAPIRTWVVRLRCAA